ncbi:MAG: DUF4178 domain-containing protein [Deltaproteobacteria bacterium]|nr:MAG: DUF4178 domain-containing protein [Deltaproteobacteria bacterium]TNF30313.1 MAG: DUF4178 domain-containing protein [Deltaproteobacteria bacterium]
MTKINCPSCGGEIPFRSSTSVFAVCPYCKSTVVRHDLDLELIGKMADLPDDMSPIQLMMSGRFNKKTFFVAGRIIVKYEDGFWNEWYLNFDDGSSGWLAEAGGDLAINFPVASGLKISDKSYVQTGAKHQLDGKNFYVTDVKKMVCVGSEGELPFRGIEGRQSLNVDLSDRSGGFASIEFNDDDGVQAYVGQYVEFKDLKPKGFRVFQGWGKP